jgi:hypothetical protein
VWARVYDESDRYSVYAIMTTRFHVGAIAPRKVRRALSPRRTFVLPAFHRVRKEHYTRQPCVQLHRRSVWRTSPTAQKIGWSRIGHEYRYLQHRYQLGCVSVRRVAMSQLATAIPSPCKGLLTHSHVRIQRETHNNLTACLVRP